MRYVTYSPLANVTHKFIINDVDREREEILSSLGFLIRQKRRLVGISQEELAARSKLDRTYISGVERGVRNPSLTALLKIADGLQLSTSALLDGLENSLHTGDLNDSTS